MLLDQVAVHIKNRRVLNLLGQYLRRTAERGGAFAAQAVQNYPDLLFGRMALAGCPADVLHDPLRRRFRVHGFLSHLHSLMVTMSQKSSVPQAVKSVSQALMPDSGQQGPVTCEQLHIAE